MRATLTVGDNQNDWQINIFVRGVIYFNLTFLSKAVDSF